MVKNLATAEQVAKDLRSQLEAKDTEFKRYRAESTSAQKRLEKVSFDCCIMHSCMTQTTNSPLIV